MKFKPKTKDHRSFVKLTDGQTVTGIFRGEAFEFRTHWHERRSVVCPGDGCELCMTKDKPKYQFRVNFITKENEAYIAKIWQGSYNFYDQLRDLNTDYPIDQNILKITRDGSGLHTKYKALPILNSQITPELEAKISQIPLNELGHITDFEKEPADGPDLSDIPF